MEQHLEMIGVLSPTVCGLFLLALFSSGFTASTAVYNFDSGMDDRRAAGPERLQTNSLRSNDPNKRRSCCCETPPPPRLMSGFVTSPKTEVGWHETVDGGRPCKSRKDNSKEWTGQPLSSVLHIADDSSRWASVGGPRRRPSVTCL